MPESVWFSIWLCLMIWIFSVAMTCPLAPITFCIWRIKGKHMYYGVRRYMKRTIPKCHNSLAFDEMCDSMLNIVDGDQKGFSIKPLKNTLLMPFHTQTEHTPWDPLSSACVPKEARRDILSTTRDILPISRWLYWLHWQFITWKEIVWFKYEVLHTDLRPVVSVCWRNCQLQHTNQG